MKTKHSHTLTAQNINANHSWNGKLTITASEIVGEVEHEVEIEVTPQLLKSLVQKSGRNALIEAKVIRGKKKW